jgi:predicted DNA-binding transcriptional regulator YafY
MEKILMAKQIAASILGQDQLVFTYAHKNDDGSTEICVRYVTPIELDLENVLCAQHLPEEGYRKFKLDRIQKFHRVLTRNMFLWVDKDEAKKAEDE